MLIGQWNIVSIGNLLLAEDETGMIVFSPYKGSKVFNFSICSQTNNQINWQKVLVKNNTIERKGELKKLARSQLENELYANHVKISNYKIESDFLILYDEENKITFTAKKIKNSK